MTIDNQKQAVNLKIQKTVALLVLVIAFGIIYFTNILVKGVFGFTRDHVAIMILILFILFYTYHYLRNHNYIYYSDTGDRFILRYFSLRPLTDKKHSIEFHKSEFHMFEISRSIFRFRATIIIYRRTSRGIAKYPPVSITALGKEQREKMMASFQKLILANQPK